MSNLTTEHIKDREAVNLLIANFKVIHSLKEKMFEKEFVDKDMYYSLYKEYFSLTISEYFRAINPHYNDIIETFKNKYINTEAIVEKNDTPEQIEGIRNLYDYIQSASTDNINILVESLKMNSILWKPTDDKNNKDIIELKEQLNNEYNNLVAEAKQLHDANKYKEALKIKNELDGLNYKSKIGGQIRNNNVVDEVKLQDVDFNVPSATDALLFINNFSSKEKMDEFNKYLHSDNLEEYIDYCIKINVDLIKYQPFMDGNKRTFRGLLNLLFKARNLPPIYIRIDEIDEYKKALFNAIQNNDYSDINFFYLFKICSSIYELDVEPYMVMEENKESINTVDNANKNIRNI